MQQDQIQKLTQLIQSSKVLHNDERDVWLAMIPVMNDKQAADLFNILNSSPAPKVSADTQPRNVSTNSARSSSLSHITNLPNDFSQVKQQRQPQTFQEPRVIRRAEPPANLAEVIKHRVEEKELPAPEEFVEIESGHKAQPQSNLVKPSITQPLKANLKKTFPFQGNQNYIPLDEVMKQRDAERVDQRLKQATQNDKPQEKVVRVSTESSGSINVPVESYSKDAILNSNFTSVKNALVAMVRDYGYFSILFKFEQSPLYKDYLNTGKAWLLGNGQSTQTPLNKEQFEQVADLLRSIQISQTK